jgi:hypothetical protein
VALHRNLDQRVRLHGQVSTVLCLVARQGLHRALAPPSPDVIACDPEQPREDSRPIRSIPGRSFDDRYEHVLHHIVGHGRRAGDVRGEPVDIGPVSPIEQREGLAVAPGDPGDQLVVYRWSIVSHLRVFDGPT